MEKNKLSIRDEIGMIWNIEIQTKHHCLYIPRRVTSRAADTMEPQEMSLETFFSPNSQFLEQKTRDATWSPTERATDENHERGRRLDGVFRYDAICVTTPNAVRRLTKQVVRTARNQFPAGK